MKVISGLYKGRKLEGFDLLGTRPTMDRVKESLFAIIQNNISGSIVLDLFAGSGNLGIEALSMGASKAYFGDSNKKAIKIINNNIKNLGIDEAFYDIRLGDFKQLLKEYCNGDIRFDLIFLDPPYDTDYISVCMGLIDRYHLLNNNGIVICESNKLEKINEFINYKIIKMKKYGDKYVVLFKKI